eukprot:tig00020563_g11195.t1
MSSKTIILLVVAVLALLGLAQVAQAFPCTSANAVHCDDTGSKCCRPNESCCPGFDNYANTILCCGQNEQCKITGNGRPRCQSH